MLNTAREWVDANHPPRRLIGSEIDMGTPGYVGPCPPPGSPKHHYNFMLFPLKVDKLEVPPGATSIYIQLAIFNATGTVDFDDVSVVPQVAK